MTTIESFRGRHDFLSNFHANPITFDGITYPTAEHAFQAQKTHDQEARGRIATLATPGKAKYAGKRVTLRPDWEQVKREVMEAILRVKFAPGTALAAELIATGDATLIEGNTWNDRYWGVCRGTGQNHLGLILMAIREDLRGA